MHRRAIPKRIVFLGVPKIPASYQAEFMTFFIYARGKRTRGTLFVIMRVHQPDIVKSLSSLFSKNEPRRPTEDTYEQTHECKAV